MTETVRCACGKMLEIDNAQRGESGQCPVCGNRFVIGGPVGNTAIQEEPSVNRVSRRGSADPIAKLDIEKPRSIVPLACWSMAALVAVLAIGYLLFGRFEYTLSDVAHAQVSSLTRACQAFYLKNERFPKDLAELMEHDEGRGPYLESPDALIDPWGQRFQYDRKGARNDGRRPDIWTVTPDGIEIGNWPKAR